MLQYTLTQISEVQHPISADSYLGCILASLISNRSSKLNSLSFDNEEVK